MKKLSKILFGLVITSFLLIGFLQLAPRITPDVGWNTGPSASLSQDHQFAYGGPIRTPDVGWNT